MSTDQKSISYRPLRGGRNSGFLPKLIGVGCRRFLIPAEEVNSSSCGPRPARTRACARGWRRPWPCRPRPGLPGSSGCARPWLASPRRCWNAGWARHHSAWSCSPWPCRHREAPRTASATRGSRTGSVRFRSRRVETHRSP